MRVVEEVKLSRHHLVEDKMVMATVKLVMA